MEEITIAIACELAPAKTLIPIIKKIKKMENLGKLNWKKSNIICLTHGSGVKELLEPYCDEFYSIGKGRGSGKVKRNNFELAYLIFKDIIKAILGLRGKGIDLLITCGNAGDVRKSISAANLLKIPAIHIEQDIYNPIETIAFSNLVTVPSESYKNYLSEKYHIDSTENIQGYPMVNYIIDCVINNHLLDNKDIKKDYGYSKFILVVLGGDLKISDIKKLINILEKINLPTLIAPYRFKKELIQDMIKSNKIKVLNEFVDLLSLMKSSNLMIYGAGMGMTIEAGVLEIPSIKIAGFHKEHGSVDLANDLKIPILEIEEVSDFLDEFKDNHQDKYDHENKHTHENKDNNKCKDNHEDKNSYDDKYEDYMLKMLKNKLPRPESEKLIKNSEIAVENFVDIINNFNLKNPPKKSGLKSMKAIWKKRSEFR